MENIKEFSQLVELVATSNLEMSKKADFMRAIESLENKVRRLKIDARYMAKKVQAYDQPQGNVIAEEYLQRPRLKNLS
ncbi:hypothetical protein [Fulvivirga sp.]|uniref:hypothetical protein n=1 Tax=Fulvivirga sp. TaxID=1931237 RepID=UPI0032EBA276